LEYVIVRVHLSVSSRLRAKRAQEQREPWLLNLEDTEQNVFQAS